MGSSLDQLGIIELPLLSGPELILDRDTTNLRRYLEAGYAIKEIKENVWYIDNIKKHRINNIKQSDSDPKNYFKIYGSGLINLVKS